jgi:hypothetical protein
MPITRCSEQSRCSLEEFYQEIAANKVYDPADAGGAMLKLLKLINTLFKQTQIWGLTSHASLLLQTTDDSASGWYVAIGSSGQDYYYLEYLLPVNKQPWCNAQVRGEVQSLAEAEKYLLIAMRESEGWLGNEELYKLLAERNL